MRQQVIDEIGIQRGRFGKDGTMTNAAMSKPELEKHCELDESSQVLMKQDGRAGFERTAFDKMRKVAKTIADL